MGTLSGGGEVRLSRLDDVSRNTISDDRFLQYDADSKKFILVKLDDDYTTKVNEDNTISVINLPQNTPIGPIEQLSFDTTHDHTEARVLGTLCWDNEDGTLNLTHEGGVVQQIGQELYAKVLNNTGSLIPNETIVRFDGVGMNGAARLEVAPFLANGSFPTLFGLGVATQDLEDGSDEKITVWGKIRQIDTTGGSENWQIGDILYVSPVIAGGLTNIKPTAPNNVVPIASVLRIDATEGEIFVRPTIEQQEYYGRFARTTDQTAPAINTPYAIEFDDTEISNGVSIGTPSSRITVVESGYYQFDLSIQVTASSNKGIVYLWYRKNGVDIPYSSRRTTLTNNDTFTLAAPLQISLNANDYIELIWAVSAEGIFLDANETPTVGPSVASVLLSVGQLQL